MEDKVKSEIENWMSTTNSFLQSFGSMAEDMKSKLTPEQQKEVDAELSKIDASKIKQDLNNAFAEFGKMVSK